MARRQHVWCRPLALAPPQRLRQAEAQVHVRCAQAQPLLLREPLQADGALSAEAGGVTGRGGEQAAASAVRAERGARLRGPAWKG